MNWEQRQMSTGTYRAASRPTRSVEIVFGASDQRIEGVATGRIGSKHHYAVTHRNPRRSIPPEPSQKIELEGPPSKPDDGKNNQGFHRSRNDSIVGKTDGDNMQLDRLFSFLGNLTPSREYVRVLFGR
jgi:hypothetical protein